MERPRPTDQSALSHRERLSLNIRDAANTPLPPSSPARYTANSPRSVSSPAPRPSPSLRRSSSSMSIRRDASPALGRRTSMASLRNGDSPLSSPKLSNRRSSSNLLMSLLAPAVEEPPPPTANSIAQNHFTEELALHSDPSTPHPKTLVILHDSCYGHRFSRPRTKQGDLNLIVERPERVRAGVMGISTAYVRLGERHAGGSHAPHPKRKPVSQLPFRIYKTSRTLGLDAEPVVAVHGKELMREVHKMCENAATKLATTGREVERDDQEKRSFHTGDLYLCNESLQALQGALGGVCDAVDAVFDRASSAPSKAFVCIRPPGHHCSSDFPSGFCWLNNVHVGIQHAIQKHGLTHAAIIDFDLHHGDGSQEIAWAHNEHMFYPEKPTPLSKRPFIGYYSLHDINSFPCEGGDREKVQNASLCIDNSHGQSIWNIHLRSWRTIQEFWEIYEQHYLVLLDKARTFLKQQTEERSRAKGNQKPRAAIFISAGFDASEHEGGGMQRHKFNVPTEFYARFTKDIVNLAQEQGTSVDGRVISVLEGGYSNKALISGVLSHISGLCDGNEKEVDEDTKLANGIAGIGLSGLAPVSAVPSTLTYNTEWWHPSHLDILDQLLEPTPVVPVAGASRKVRLATYSTPTTASTMKAVDPTKVHLNHRIPSAAPSRPATPPAPDVDWEIAASELAQLLIPSDRDTRSNTAAALAEPRVKAERTSAGPLDNFALPAPVTAGRTLRDRKAKVVTPPVEAKPITARKASADRRKTIAEALPKAENSFDGASREPKRRLSVASTVSTASVATNTTTTATTARSRVTKTMSNGVDVKKTRGVATQPAARQAPGRRVSSATQVNKETSKSPDPATTDVMDDLTSSIKRITIKVPSNDEYASRPKKPAANSSRPSPATTAGRGTGISATAKRVPVTKNATSKPTSLNGTKRTPAASVNKTANQATAGSGAPQVQVKQEVISPQFSPTVTPPLATQAPLQSNHNPYVQDMFANQPFRANGQPSEAGSEIMANQAQYTPDVQTQYAPPQISMPPEMYQYPNREQDRISHVAQNTAPYSALQWITPNSEPGLPKPSDMQQQQQAPPAFTATSFIPFQAPGQRQNQQNQ